VAAFYTELYIADPADAEAVGCEEDAIDRWPSVWLPHIGDQELVQLWGIVADLPDEPGRTLMAELLFQGGDDGPFVMRVPAPFVSAIAGVADEQLPEVAAAWGRTDELADWPPDELSQCWVSCGISPGVRCLRASPCYKSPSCSQVANHAGYKAVRQSRGELMSFPEQSQPEPAQPPEAASPPAPPPKPTRTLPAFRGSFRLFRLAGTDVYVHWTWFIAALFLFQGRPVPYSSLAWDAAAYVLSFGLVLLHEFGHVLACRQVGGAADQVVLWPLGGLAFVAPPPRPWAVLWTTAAGPLVNLVLVPVLLVVASLTAPAVEGEARSDPNLLLSELALFNVLMLVFNLLPVFPLDGGRLLQAVLWRWIGRPAATAVAASIGLVAGLGLGALALLVGAWWVVLLAAFLILGAIGGLAYAGLLVRIGKAERRTDLACPNCGSSPPVGDFWRCTRCFGWIDPFAPVSLCPKGGPHTAELSCPECGRQLAPADWVCLKQVAPGEPARLDSDGSPEVVV
jgi:Zn-dependent protease